MKIVVIACVALTQLSGCASSSVFSPYPQQAKEYVDAIRRADEGRALVALDKKRNTNDGVLYTLEHGRISQLAGRYNESVDDFNLVLQSIEKEQARATISVTNTAAQATSLLVNDNTRPYSVAPYEQVFVHQFQALNFLALDKLEAASVEVRRANAVQNQLLEIHYQELAELESNARNNQVNLSDPSIRTYVAGLDKVSGNIKNSFQNAYTFYLSGLIYEAINEPNSAFIDYKKALEIYPDNSYLQQDVVRLAQALDMQEDLAYYQERFKQTPQVQTGNPGKLIVLYEQGFVPAKKEAKIVIPTLHGYFAVAFPFFNDLANFETPLRISLNNQLIGGTQKIVDVYTLAAKSLKEQVPGMVLRQTLRSVAKYNMRKKAGDQGGALGFIGATIYNLISENADLRSWLTLPRSAGILLSYVAPGQHNLQLQGYNLSRVLPIEVIANKTIIVRVIDVGTRLIVQTTTL